MKRLIFLPLMALGISANAPPAQVKQDISCAAHVAFISLILAGDKEADIFNASLDFWLNESRRSGSKIDFNETQIIAEYESQLGNLVLQMNNDRDNAKLDEVTETAISCAEKSGHIKP